MITIKLKDKEYDFPEHWNELKLGTYQDAMSLINIEDDIDKTVKLLSVISKIPEDDLLDLHATSFIQLNGIVASLLNMKAGEPKLIVEIQGVKYSLMTRISDIKTAEFIDLDTLISDTENTIINLHTILAVLYRPIISENDYGYIIEDYDSSKVEARAELFKQHMTCDVVFSALSFSLAFVQIYTEVIRDCLEQEALNPNKLTNLSEGLMRMMKHLQVDGDGMP
jgi:hypothetical protein